MVFKRKFLAPLAALALTAVLCLQPRPAAAEAGADGAAAAPYGKTPLTVTSDKMEAAPGENRVVFSGNVKAVEDFTLCSDQLEIVYGEERDVTRIEASGNVRIFRGDKKSTSERVVYDREERTLVLTGDARITQCNDTIKGDRITLSLDKDDARIEGGENGTGGRVRAVIMPEKGCAEAGAGKGEAQGEEALCEGPR